MARHAPGDRVDGVRDFDAAGLEQVRQFADAVLRLGNGQAVAGDDDDLAGVGELDGGVVDRDLADGCRPRSSSADCVPSSAPKPPTMMLAIDRFMALAMSRVRIAPEAPTRAPATISMTLPTTKPAIETAVPVKALSSEMTTGMSAPPIGSTISHAEDEGAGQGHDQQHVEDAGVVGDDARAGQDEHDRDAQAGDHGEPRQDPAAGEHDRLAADEAHQLGRGDQRAGEGHRADEDVGEDEERPPAVEAGSAAGQDAVAVEGDEVVEGQQGRGAAADGVEERDELRHGGHGHGPGHAQAEAAADGQAADDDRPVPEADVALRRRRRPPPATAMIMPAAERRLPVRAVAGEFIRCRPTTKSAAPTMKASWTR